MPCDVLLVALPVKLTWPPVTPEMVSSDSAMKLRP